MPSPSSRPSIVVGVDGSPNSIAAAELAVTVAVRGHKALRLVYATPPGHPHSNPPHPPDSILEFVDAVHVSHPDLAISHRIAPLPASQLLLDESESASLVVVGCPSHGAERQATEPCTAEAVKQAAECHVVIARPAHLPRPRGRSADRQM